MDAGRGAEVTQRRDMSVNASRCPAGCDGSWPRARLSANACCAINGALSAAAPSAATGCGGRRLSLPRLCPPSCWCARGTSHNTCATRPQAAGYVATSRIAAARTFVASAPKMAKAPSPPSMPSEFTGKTTMSISKIAGSKKDAGVDKLHDYDGPIGFVSLSLSLSLTFSRSRARALSLSLSLSLARVCITSTLPTQSARANDVGLHG